MKISAAGRWWEIGWSNLRERREAVIAGKVLAIEQGIRTGTLVMDRVMFYEKMKGKADCHTFFFLLKIDMYRENIW